MADCFDSVQRIYDFPSLIGYLNADLDWPVEAADFENLVFDLSALTTTTAAATARMSRKRRRFPGDAGNCWSFTVLPLLLGAGESGAWYGRTHTWP